MAFGVDQRPAATSCASIAAAVQDTPSSRASHCLSCWARRQKRFSLASSWMLAARASALRVLSRCVAGLTPSRSSVRPQTG